GRTVQQPAVRTWCCAHQLRSHPVHRRDGGPQKESAPRSFLRQDRTPEAETATMKLAVEYPYLCKDRDRHGNVRYYFRRNGRKIRIRVPPAWPASVPPIDLIDDFGSLAPRRALEIQRLAS